MQHKPPEWFTLSESITPMTLERLSKSLNDLQLPLQVKNLPLQAFWFLLTPCTSRIKQTAMECTRMHSLLRVNVWKQCQSSSWGCPRFQAPLTCCSGGNRTR
jgi:hypothetical protein